MKAMRRERIKELRLEFGLSQERFAQLLGVSLQTVRRWENGLSRPLPIIDLRLEELENEPSKAQHKRGGVSMSERRKRSGEPLEVSLGGLLKGMGGLFDLVAQMTEEGTEERTGSGKVSALGGKVKGVYGFSLRVGLGGRPIIEQFGNVKATEEGAVVAEVREPLVDVLDEGDYLVIIAELPGVEAEDVHQEVEGDILELRAETSDRKYSKEVLLPAAVDPASMRSSYRNGILEIRLRKK